MDTRNAHASVAKHRETGKKRTMNFDQACKIWWLNNLVKISPSLEETNKTESSRKRLSVYEIVPYSIEISAHDFDKRRENRSLTRNSIAYRVDIHTVRH